LVIVSFSSYADLEEDVNFIRKPLLAALTAIPATSNTILDVPRLLKWMLGVIQPDGVDRKRPWGAVVDSDGQHLRTFFFIPVVQLPTLLSAAKVSLREARDVGGGIFEIEGPLGRAYIQQRGTWAFICNARETLGEMPTDPIAGLKGWNQRYRFAVEARVGEIPRWLRQLATDSVRNAVEADLKQEPGESPQQFALRRAKVHTFFDQCADLDSLSVGWRDKARQTPGVDLDVAVAGAKGTKLAQALAGLSGVESRFAGMMHPDAALAVRATWRLSPDEVQDTVAQLNEARRQVLAQCAPNLSNAPAGSEAVERTRAMQSAADSVFDVLQGIAEGGQIDWALAVVLRRRGSGMVFAAQTTRADLAQTTFRTLSRKMLPELTAPIEEEWNDLHVHSVSIPVGNDPSNRENFGDTLYFTLGSATDRIYLSAGAMGLGVVKQFIGNPGPRPVPPLEISVHLVPWLELCLKYATADAVRTQITDALRTLGRSDEIHLTANSIDCGVRFRLDCDDGVMQVLRSLQEKDDQGTRQAEPEPTKHETAKPDAPASGSGGGFF